MDQIKIRPADITDAAVIRLLSRQAFSRYGPYDETLTSWFLSGEPQTVLALADDRIVGFAMLGQSFFDYLLSECYEVLAIAVIPDIQKLGIGSLLMDQVEQQARGLHARKMVLHTAMDNLRAQRLFNRHGFMVVEIKRSFYPRGQDAVMMTKDI